jgi:methyl-accepting chemotaxis protein
MSRLQAEYRDALRQLQMLRLEPREREGVDTLASLERELEQATKDALAQGEGAATAGAFQSRAAAVVRKSSAQIDRLAGLVVEGYRNPARAFVERGRTATVIVLACTAAIVILVVLVAWTITRSITLPLREAVNAASRVASGDLTGEIVAHGRDEAAELLRAMAGMNTRLGEMVSRIRRSAESIAANADQVAEGNEQLASRTEEQASSLEESASTLEQFTTTVRQGADSAGQANEHAGEAARIARDGEAAMRAVVERIGALAEASSRIRDVVGAIDGIAFQTNLLALNAAVEAAHAGDHGRGFAVVATEVRALAARASASAKEISGLIRTSVEDIGASADLVESAGGTIAELAAAVSRVSGAMQSIAAAGIEQSAGIEQINRAIGQMDVAVQKNAALVSQASAAASELNGEAATLVQSVASFRLFEAELLPYAAPGSR